jgi:cysteinyl-tRNA synthetase, unknown class
MYKLRLCFSIAAGILVIMILSTCVTKPVPTDDIDYRLVMKKLIMDISSAAKETRPDFGIIVNNGEELLTVRGSISSKIDMDYIDILNGFLIESLYFGSSGVDSVTAAEQRNFILPYLKKLKKAGVPVLVIDYCADRVNIDASLKANKKIGFMAFPAPRRELDIVPEYSAEYDFLYLLNPGSFESRQVFIDTVADTRTGLVVVDGFYGSETLTRAEVSKIAAGPDGTRPVYAYMSVGEASDFRYYWRSSWKAGRPDWLIAANPNWPGSYKVAYWDDRWKDLLLQGDSSYLSRLMEAGFNGVVLDTVDSYQYFEDNRL